MWASGFASCADVADHLPLYYVLAHGNNNFCRVRIQSLASIAVLDDRIVRISPVPPAVSCNNNVAVSRRHDGGADRRRDVNGVIAVNALRMHTI